MNISVTDRVQRLIDQHFGLDLYLLETPDVDIDSRLGIDLKRQLLLALASKVRNLTFIIKKLRHLLTIFRTIIIMIPSVKNISRTSILGLLYLWKKLNGMDLI